MEEANRRQMADERTDELYEEEPREDVVEQPQCHAPQDVSLDVDPVDEQRLGKPL